MLPAYKPPSVAAEKIGPLHSAAAGKLPQTAAEADSFGVLLKALNLKGLFASLGLAVLVAAIGGASFSLHWRNRPCC